MTTLTGKHSHQTLAKEFRPNREVENLEHRAARAFAMLLEALGDDAPRTVERLFGDWAMTLDENPLSDADTTERVERAMSTALAWAASNHIQAFVVVLSTAMALLEYVQTGKAPDRIRVAQPYAQSRPDDDLTMLRKENADRMESLFMNTDHEFLVEAFRQLAIGSPISEFGFAFSSTFNLANESLADVKKRILSEVEAKLESEIHYLRMHALAEPGAVKPLVFEDARHFQRFVKYQVLVMTMKEIAKSEPEKVSAQSVSDSVALVARLTGISQRKSARGRPKQTAGIRKRKH